MARRLAPLALLLIVSCGGGEPPASVADAGPPHCTLGTTMAEIEAALFRGPKCMPCHSKATLYPTSLDLVSSGLAARVVDQPAAMDNPARGKCAGRILLPRSDPQGSLFVEKVEQAHPSCGDPMPQGMTMLSANEVACVKLWATLATAAP
jgi:hypothetical protein